MVVIDNSRIHEAFEEEAKGIDVQDLMAQMMESFNQEKGYTPTVVDEVRIRKMMLARNYLTKEKERLVILKQAIMNDWDERIAAKSGEIQSINDFIESYLKNYNQGKKLALDVGTATLSRTAPKAVLDAEKKEEAVNFLKQHGVLSSFQKPAELDVTLLQNSYTNQFKELVEKEAKERIQKEVDASDKGKITKKRENEITLEVEAELAADYYAKLPDFMKYVPEQQKLSIRMK
jgi:hypothetical protein